MSNTISLSPDKNRKRPSVSSKCLLNIKSIVTQNVSINNNNKTACLRSPTSIPPPLPVINSLISSKDSINNFDNTKEIENKNRKKSQSFPNQNILIECIKKSDLKKTFDQQISTINGHDRIQYENSKSPSISIELSQVSINKTEHRKLPSRTSSNSNISKETNSEQNSSQKSLQMNKNEPSIIPPLPLKCSIYPFDLSSSSDRTKPLLSFPTQPSNNLNETKLNEHSIPNCQLIPIHRFDSTSQSISTIDEDEDDDINLSQSIIIVNSSLHLPVDPIISNQTISMKARLSERTEKEFYNHRKVKMNSYDPSPHFSRSYTRLPHSLRNMNSLESGTIRSPTMITPAFRRQFPQFESVRTPVQKSSMIKQEFQSKIPSELFDCCQTETVSLTTEIITTQRSVNQRNSQRQTTTIETSLNESEARLNYFRDVEKIREIMINVSKRLIQENDSITKIPIVDTHCHFDLIFDRLRIKHNNLKKYFNDYNEYYPSGLSFELAIQVFWRPKHLTENNWINWYSSYLDDERVYGSCGIHPHWSSAWNETSIDDIERCLKHPKIVAIGEIGLDFGPKNECLIHEQRRAFEAQLKLAAKWLKPIVIHSRDAYQETFQLMRQYLEPDHKIHLHCFVGTMNDVELFTSYFTEIKFGFTPIITRTNFLHTTIQQLELTQILSETDSPYFTPEELSTLSRCAHPGMVYSVVETIAQLRHLPVMDVACQLRENARHIYGV
ncbi:unnamed protein product [Rotaria sordida]|uniref:Uncharacterized protein n=1 Tax=Rotaria sordida TaxID=392033 RepID=A0A815FQG5_9BILA|nr:unnamed protein product [Rotaria sordida]CAF1288435.1 unnamed protein product [Rotaria sordida]CAF1328955.1 unnamed protein product [Rotaria sordida]CAF3528721.1 unnamed protein product [Rotaria sordida]CAF3883129.1 unnamed protein product [Rotaria sordida]